MFDVVMDKVKEGEERTRRELQLPNHSTHRDPQRRADIEIKLQTVLLLPYPV